jgi:soluble lytic murein transglycosylase-like protein
VRRLLAALCALSLGATAAQAHGGGLSGIALYRVMAERAGQRHGVPPELVEAVMRIESGYRAEARGRDGEVGLMQVLPSTAVMLGFRGGPEDLADPATNIDLGARYLAGAWRLSGGDICTAGMKYRAGHGETEFSFLSNVYCSKLKRNLIVADDGSIRLTPYKGQASAVQTGERRRCFRRVVQAGARFGQCITREELAARGLMRKPRS